MNTICSLFFGIPAILATTLANSLLDCLSGVPTDQVLAYIIPFVLLIAVVVILNGRLDNEPLVGTLALCLVGVYFIILKLFGKEIEKWFKRDTKK